MSEGAQPRHVGEQHQQQQPSASTSKVVGRRQNNLQQKPPHHGSSSTTFSTGSSLSGSTTSCGDGEAIEPSSYYSSGVATMSSFDNLPPSMAKLISGSGTTAPDADLNLDSDEDCGRNNTLKASSTSALNCNALQWDLGLAENSQAMDSLRLQSSPRASAASIAAVAAVTSLAGPASAPAGAASFPRMPSTRSTGSGMTEAALCEAARRQAGLLPPASPASHSTSSSSHQLQQQQQQHSSTSPLPPPLTSVAMTCANSCTQIICTPLRTIVSQNRRRYQQDGFNLDLTYITDRIIAMGYPADTKEALYRNSMSHIVKFLEHYHPGHYKVFNLRGQYVYDASKFHNRVVSFEMTDHHPPRLELMAPFCREVGDYLEADPRNVVAVHCKAGKGRTGVMICAYLCYIAFYRSPRQNMDYYSIVRTHNNKGVTIPSQRRYVYYFSHLRERRLNYMPLRVELVGVYVERPPKLSGTFSKGALNVQVANGDVDVFLGDDLWLSEEKSEEEDEMYKRYPVMIGDDQYDPNRPAQGKDCISRRCYGWSVPANKRVFLEGDIRVDIHQKRVLPVFNVKQDKKKIGRVWFNTMFVCPGFCGGEYVHGDEAYPYPEGESMIVQRVVRKKSSQSLGAPENIAEAFTAPSEHHPHSIAPDEGRHPSQAQPQREHNSNGGEKKKEELVEEERQSSIQSSLLSATSKSKSSRTSRDMLRTTFNGVSKKRPCRSPCSQLIDSEKKGWSSQDGEFTRRRGVDEGGGPPLRGHKCRSSLDHTTSILSSSSSTRVCRSARGSGEGCGEVEESLEGEEEIVVPEPPGLSIHCPPESIQEIYHSEKQAPRVGIVDILKEAYKRNLLRDMYNARRFSVPKEGNLMPKSAVGRPNAESTPRCLMREKVEHVATYSAQEVDGAHKSKEVDMNYFKLYIVTKCVDERNAADVRLTDSFLRITHQKQLRRDEAKREKLEGRQKKLSSQPPVKPIAVDATYGGVGEQGDESSSFSSDGIHDSAAGVHGGDSSPFLLREFNDDPRLSDPYLRKFFFRQRISSHSRHPSVHYHCPLLEPDLLICARHNCHLSTASSAPTAIASKSSSSTIPSPSSSAGVGNHQRTSYRRQMHFPSRGLASVGTSADGGERDEGEERDDESGGEDSGSGGGQGGDNNFENFDFFHPNAFASLKERRVMLAREDSSTASLGSSTLHNRTPIDSTATPTASTSANTTAIYVRSATLTSVDARDELAAGEHLLERSPNAKNREGRSGHSAREERLRGRSTGDLLFGDGGAMGDEPARDFHPSDCSWASSSSTSSSTQSLEDPDSTPPRMGS